MDQLNKIFPILDSSEIEYGSIEKAKDWHLLSLKKLIPDSINLFLCDYKNRDLVKQGRKKAISQLEKSHGGSLGILFLSEIIIGTNQSKKFQTELLKIPGIDQKDNTFSFSEGPSITLIPSDSFSFGLLIKVNSLEKVKTELDTLDLEVSETKKGLEVSNGNLDFQMTFYE